MVTEIIKKKGSGMEGENCVPNGSMTMQTLSKRHWTEFEKVRFSIKKEC